MFAILPAIHATQLIILAMRIVAHVTQQITFAMLWEIDFVDHIPPHVTQ
jgi:hypothetical protein